MIGWPGLQPQILIRIRLPTRAMQRQDCINHYPPVTRYHIRPLIASMRKRCRDETSSSSEKGHLTTRKVSQRVTKGVRLHGMNLVVCESNRGCGRSARYKGSVRPSAQVAFAVTKKGSRFGPPFRVYLGNLLLRMILRVGLISGARCLLNL